MARTLTAEERETRHKMLHERFCRVAPERTNKILDELHTLGNCSNRINYVYTEDEVEQIFQAISECLKHEKEKFLRHDAPPKIFTLNDTDKSSDEKQSVS